MQLEEILRKSVSVLILSVCQTTMEVLFVVGRVSTSSAGPMLPVVVEMPSMNEQQFDKGQLRLIGLLFKGQNENAKAHIVIHHIEKSHGHFEYEARIGV